jgi:hypothetical protein
LVFASLNVEGGYCMKVLVLKSPRFLSKFLKAIFGIKEKV